MFSTSRRPTRPEPPRRRCATSASASFRVRPGRRRCSAPWADRDLVMRVLAESRPGTSRSRTHREIICCHRRKEDLRRAEGERWRSIRKSRMLCVDEDGCLVGVIACPDIAQRERGTRASETLRQVVSARRARERRSRGGQCHRAGAPLHPIATGLASPAPGAEPAPRAAAWTAIRHPTGHARLRKARGEGPSSWAHAGGCAMSIPTRSRQPDGAGRR